VEAGLGGKTEPTWEGRGGGPSRGEEVGKKARLRKWRTKPEYGGL